MTTYTEITKCRICGGENLIEVLSLGKQALTGVFPCKAQPEPTSGPLGLLWCSDCGLLQMKQSYNINEMYGYNYGYRSSLNASMVSHLAQKVKMLENIVHLTTGDTVLDIGSNDGTLLSTYSIKCNRIGIDPTCLKFEQYYPKDVITIPEFFSAFVFKELFPEKHPKIITSIAMFYDLEDPKKFVQDVYDILDDEGIWHLEQAYMPAMLRSTAYDAVCHEHLEFYSFGIIRRLVESCNMRIVDVEMNATNGGSFAVTVCKKDASYKSNTPVIEWMLRQENNLQLNTPFQYRLFEQRVYQHRENLTDLIRSLNEDGKLVFGYGASTKGNVLLQFCGLTKNDIPFIADVNPDKFGCFTPGTHIPIISEKDAKDMHPDYFLVFPWHFKHNIMEREKEYLANGGKFIFPLPEIEIV